MKFKYFLRGLGVGILFASIVFLVAYNGKPSHKMSDADIIEKAKELGMVEPKDPIKDLLTTEKDKKKDITEKKEQSISEATAEKTTEKETTEKTSTEKVTTENVTTEKATTEEKTSELNSGQEVSITVSQGNSSYVVCQKIEAAGIIENAAELDTYLVENGYANRIRIDTYQLKKGMDFHDIAEIITKTP